MKTASGLPLSPQTAGQWSLLCIKGISGHAPAARHRSAYTQGLWHLLSGLRVLPDACHMVVHAEERDGDGWGEATPCWQHKADNCMATSEGPGAVCPGHTQGRG